MSKNKNPSLLDNGQILKSLVNDKNDSVRVEFHESQQMAVSLNASEDSVTALPNVIEASVSVDTSSEQIVINALDCRGIKTFSLYVSEVSAPNNVKVSMEVSPSETDDIWFPTSLSLSLGQPAYDTISDIAAVRCRVSLSAPLTSGEFKAFLVGQAI